MARALPKPAPPTSDERRHNTPTVEADAAVNVARPGRRGAACLPVRAANHFALVPDALALVGLRWSDLADVRGDFAEPLLVDPLDANTIGRSRRCPRCRPGLTASAPPAFIYASAEIRSAAVEGPDRGDAPGVTVAGWVVGVSGSVAAGALASALLTPSTSSRSEKVKKSVFADVHHWWAGGVIMRTSSR